VTHVFFAGGQWGGRIGLVVTVVFWLGLQVQRVTQLTQAEVLVGGRGLAIRRVGFPVVPVLAMSTTLVLPLGVRPLGLSSPHLVPRYVRFDNY